MSTPPDDFLPDIIGGIKRVAALIYITKLDGFADFERAFVGLFIDPVIILNSVVLPAPFGPITPTIPPGGKRNDRSLISSLSAKTFFNAFGLNHNTAKPRAQAEYGFQQR